MTEFSLDTLSKELREFARERDWEQFHTPKNLAMALIVEAAELVEQFQWLTPEQSERAEAERVERIEDELADILIYLVRLSDRMGVDLPAAVARKMDHNRRKYPADMVRGKAAKYDEY